MLFRLDGKAGKDRGAMTNYHRVLLLKISKVEPMPLRMKYTSSRIL